MIRPTEQKRSMITVATAGVIASVTPEELYAITTELFEKMKTPDPDNPNLWSTQRGGHTFWGILDEGAGPNGEDVFTILFASEY
jgi:hypothetical protein